MEEAAAPVVNVVGERVALGPGRRDLLAFFQRWDNEFSVQAMLGEVPRPITLEQEQVWYDRADVSGEARTIAFVIYRRADWRALGATALADIDHRQRTAAFSIAIGEPADRGWGYGTEATRLVLDYAFTALGLHSVMLFVYEYNLAGRRAYAKAGFREFGRRRQTQWLNGRLWDIIYMECLASEFASPVLGRVFAPDLAGKDDQEPLPPP
ncbi:MAG TPA: GNAT family protein [Thermomicrobiales bacterium]|nr:GNAT family protein [Thermomicrobiales bacterium]